jgi:hypothetical protein
MENFISEKLTPVPGTFDTSRMSSGEPGLPGEFIWRGKNVTVKKVVNTWRTTSPCRNGSGEMYVRRHWYDIETEEGLMRIYFDRQPRGGRKEMGWFLFSIKE